MNFFIPVHHYSALKRGNKVKGYIGYFLKNVAELIKSFYLNIYFFRLIKIIVDSLIAVVVIANHANDSK